MGEGHLEHLPRLVPAAPDRPAVGGPDHPMRLVTRSVAFDRSAWTPERAREVAAAFDALAPGWSTRDAAQRDDALHDALVRGEVEGSVCLEVGSGTGGHTGALVERFDLVVAADLALEMLRRAPAAPAPRVQADAARLPLPDGSVDVAVLVNALLFPAEMARVLAPGGALVWVNALGEDTPIHLPAADVLAALPGRWRGCHGEAGWGTWAVLRRATSATGR